MLTLNDLGLDKNLYKIIEKPAIISDEVQSESIIDGEISGNLTINKGFLQSKDYVNGTSGYRLDDTGIIYCTGLEVVNGVITGATIIGGTITGTSLVGGSINVPNATTPLFSVDSLGNVVCDSLRRKDFHWFTIFESLDGFFISSTGGSPGTSPAYLSTGVGLIIPTPATTNGYSVVQCIRGVSAFSWDKRSSFKTKIKTVDFTGGLQSFDFGKGVHSYTPTDTDRKYGFRFANETVYGIVANGSNYSSVQIGSAGDYVDTEHEFEADFFPGVRCDFYIDGVLKNSLATTLPSGTISAFSMLCFYLMTLENVTKSVEVYYYDFWQSL